MSYLKNLSPYIRPRLLRRPISKGAPVTRIFFLSALLLLVVVVVVVHVCGPLLCPTLPGGGSISLVRLGFVGLKTDLQHPIAQCVSVQRLYSHNGIIIIGHCYESESFAFVRLQITNYLYSQIAILISKEGCAAVVWLLYFSYYLHGLNGSKRTEQLPQHILFGFGR